MIYLNIDDSLRLCFFSNGVVLFFFPGGLGGADLENDIKPVFLSYSFMSIIACYVLFILYDLLFIMRH